MKNSELIKKIILLISLSSHLISWAGENKPQKSIMTSLNAESINQTIQPKKVVTEIYTPYAVWFIRGKDVAPSCALINENTPPHVLEMISPSDGQFSNCHQALEEPTISFINGNYYATYTYVVEETRAELSTEYQLVKLTKEGFFQCAEDQTISEEMHKNMRKKRMKLALAIKKTIEKTGCTAMKN